MRRRSRFLALAIAVVVAAACSGDPAPLTPLPDQGRVDTLGLDMTGARQGLIDFLNGFATLTADDGRAAANASADPAVAEFAYWHLVQLQTEGGAYSGLVHIDHVEVIGSDPNVGRENLVLDVAAEVELIHQPDGGEVRRLIADFSGPAVMFRAEPDGWGVADLTFQGQTVQDILQVIGVGVRTGQGVRVEASSLLDPSEGSVIQVNVRLVNPTDRYIALMLDRSGMTVGPATTPFVALSVPLWAGPGETIETQVVIPAIPEMGDRSLPIVLVLALKGFRQAGKVDVVEIPIRDQGVIPPPDASEQPIEPSPSPAGTPIG